MTESPYGPPGEDPQNPYGHGGWGQYPPSQPPTSSLKGATILLAAVVGFVASIALPLLGFAIANISSALGAIGVLGTVAVPVLGFVLLFSDRTRSWGLGLLIGFFTALIVAAGTCFILISSYSG